MHFTNIRTNTHALPRRHQEERREIYTASSSFEDAIKQFIFSLRVSRALYECDIRVTKILKKKKASSSKENSVDAVKHFSPGHPNATLIFVWNNLAQVFRSGLVWSPNFVFFFEAVSAVLMALGTLKNAIFLNLGNFSAFFYTVQDEFLLK